MYAYIDEHDAKIRNNDLNAASCDEDEISFWKLN